MAVLLGPVMLDLEAETLSGEERELLDHPAVGGVILFSRNYQTPAQLRELTAAIRSASPRPLLIAVDQEGGRVQRFRAGFTRFPPLRALGRLYAADATEAITAAANLSWLLATELLEAGLDFSFAPVLDLDHGVSGVIGDRAFAADAETVVALGRAWIDGAHAAGMITCGKHFPGHGSVIEDSHSDCPVDQRPLATLRETDLSPFAALAQAGLDAVMPAHVIYSAVDPQPAGFSHLWLKQILRAELGFDGVIFSDDLSMAAAEAAGGYADRARAALSAGCDMVIICNNRLGAVSVVDALGSSQHPLSSDRLPRLRANVSIASPAPNRREQALHALSRLESVAQDTSATG